MEEVAHGLAPCAVAKLDYRTEYASSIIVTDRRSHTGFSCVTGRRRCQISSALLHETLCLLLESRLPSRHEPSARRGHLQWPTEL